MSAFTVELRKAVELVGGRSNFRLDEYPIFDEEYRETLNNKFFEHFWYREIGFETIDMFINRLHEKMNLLMPVYNKLYLSTLMEFDPLTTTRLETKVKGTGTESTTATGTTVSDATNSSDTTSKSRAVSSEFPQMQLSGNGDYATSATDSVGESSATGEAHEAGTQEQSASGTRESESDTLMEGYTSSPSNLVLMYRETLINVDLALFTDLEALFIQIWDTADEYGDYPSYLQPLYYYGAF